MIRWAVRIAVAVAVLGVIAIAAQTAMGPVSTLMLLRRVTGQPVDRRYVSLAEISPELVGAVVLSEDGQFCRHHGVDFGALRQVLKGGEPTRGASTISMQVARNLFLWQSRSYLRKALEIPLAIVLDALWGKKRVLETYLNVAEWGEGIFGIEAAAEHDFGQHAAALTDRQSALLATALPNPILRSVRHPSPGHRLLAQRLVDMRGLEAAHTRCLQ